MKTLLNAAFLFLILQNTNNGADSVIEPKGPTTERCQQILRFVRSNLRVAIDPDRHRYAFIVSSNGDITKFKTPGHALIPDEEEPAVLGNSQEPTK